MVTVAVRRLDLTAKGEASLMHWIDTKRMRLLPNTALCYTADDAVRTCRLAEELGMSKWVKLEVLGDEKTLFPDVEETVKAARILVKEGFTVLPYTSDDPITARKLEDAGCAAVMPLAAPIGSGLGIRNPHNIRLIREMVKVPVIVDAGVGTASDAAIAMELGCDAVLMNTAIAGAKDPVRMARAMKLGRRGGARGLPRRADPAQGVRLGVQPDRGARRVRSRPAADGHHRLAPARGSSCWRALERALDVGPRGGRAAPSPGGRPRAASSRRPGCSPALCRARGNPALHQRPAGRGAARGRAPAPAGGGPDARRTCARTCRRVAS